MNSGGLELHGIITMVMYFKPCEEEDDDSGRMTTVIQISG